MIDQIEIVFSEDVTIGQSDLSVAGSEVASYGFLPEGSGGFNYDPLTFTATWTLEETINVDHVVLELKRGRDCGWLRQFVVGSRREASFKALVGDASADENANAGDYSLWADQFGKPLDSSVVRADFSGDGSVGPEDYTLWTEYFGSTVPVALQTASMRSSTASLRSGDQPAATSGDPLAERGEVDVEGLRPVRDTLPSLPTSRIERSVEPFATAVARDVARDVAMLSRTEPDLAGISSRADALIGAARVVAPRLATGIESPERVDAVFGESPDAADSPLALNLAVRRSDGPTGRETVDALQWDAALEHLLNPGHKPL